jgi:glycosyltransferase involved in cell wall biosynthesis
MTIYILTQTYLNDYGTSEVYSGLQRYIRELSRLLVSRGLKCIVMQKAAQPFEREIESGVRIVGIPAGSASSADPYFNYRAHKLIPLGAPVIYCLVELTFPCLRRRSLAIQHGIWWDGEFSRWKIRFIRYLNSRTIRQVQSIICVDTNYINWALSTLGSYDRITHKCKYIPNFVDPSSFHSDIGSAINPPSVPIVLFPRRCESKRGALLFLDACVRLWREGRVFQAMFCGWGAMQAQVKELIGSQGYSDRVSVMDVSFDEMPDVYRKAEVVVIPTLRHEGTSLSCLEALYMGKAVIATYVGGLPNLVIPHINGELIAPTADELSQAIARLLDCPELRTKYGNAAKTIAQAFTLTNWRKSVWQVVQSSLFSNLSEVGTA